MTYKVQKYMYHPESKWGKLKLQNIYKDVIVEKKLKLTKKEVLQN